MNLSQLRRGIANCRVEVGTTQKVERVPFAGLRDPVSRVLIYYTPTVLIRNFLFGWRKPERTTMWFTKALVKLKDGTTRTYRFAREGDLMTSLDWTYLKATEAALAEFAGQAQAA